jgi:outer membrane receptor protein involved in Fe transport
MAAGANLQATLTANNAFDKQPRLSPNPNFTGAPGGFGPVVAGDDAVGRYYTFALRAQY